MAVSIASREPAGAGPYSRLFARVVLAVGLGLTGVHVAFELTWRFRHAMRRELRPLFIVSDESSLVTWLSVWITAVLGLLCIAAGRAERRRGWYAVGALFLFLSMDDATMLHERIGWIVQASHGQTNVYRWIQVMGPVFAVLGLFTMAFLWHRFEGDRQARRRMLLAFGLMGAALVFEVFERMLQLDGPTWRGFTFERYTIPIEELFELIGPTLLATCVGERLERAAARRREPRKADETGPRAAA